MPIRGTQVLNRISAGFRQNTAQTTQLILNANVVTIPVGGVIYTSTIVQDGTLDRISIIAVVTGTLDLEFAITRSDGVRTLKAKTTIANGANNWLEVFDVVVGDVLTVTVTATHNPVSGSFALTSLDISAIMEV
jgi:hypothetical protein